MTFQILHLTIWWQKFDLSLQLFEQDNVWIGFDVLQTIHHECNGRNELLPFVNEKLDTERATTGNLSEGATSVDVRIVPSFIRYSGELYLAVFSAEWPAKKPRHPPDFLLRLLLKVSLCVQNSTVAEGRGFISSSILDCGMKFWSRNPF